MGVINFLLILVVTRYTDRFKGFKKVHKTFTVKDRAL